MRRGNRWHNFISGLSIIILGYFLAVASAQGNTHLDDAFLGFSNYALVDDLIVTIGLGRPMQVYHLRVVFSPELYNTQEAIGHITLYNSDRLRTSSATYETVIPGRLGRDIVEIGALRWIALIDTRPSAWHGMTYDPTTRESVDGLLFTGIDESPAPGQYWNGLFVDRSGTTWVRQASDLNLLRQTQARTHIPLEPMPSSAITPSSNKLLRGVGRVTNVNVLGYGDPLNIVVVPDLHLTYVPLELFQWYFENKNLFTDQPLEWEALRLVFPQGTPAFTLNIPGHALFPLRDNTDKSDRNSADITRVLKLLVSASIENDPLLSDLTTIENTGGSGYNTLKIMPHNLDNSTIYLGGHILWSTLALTYAYDADSTTYSLVQHFDGSALGIKEFVILTLGIFFYIRWKFDITWIDYLIGRDGYIRYYYFVISSDSILWPFIWLTLSLVACIAYWGESLQTVDAINSTIITVVFWIAWFIGLVISLVLWSTNRHEIWYQWKKMWHAVTHHSENYMSEWINHLSRNVGKEESDIIYQIPYFGPVPMSSSGRVWTEIPQYALEHQQNRGQFFWVPAPLLLLRDISLNIVVGIAFWSVISPINSPMFAAVIILFIFFFMAYACAHYFIALTYLMLWPALSRHRTRHRWPSWSIWVMWLLIGGFNGVVFYLFQHLVIEPMLEITSLFYGNSDEAVSAITLLFTVAALFIISQFTHSYLLSIFQPRVVALVKQQQQQPATKKHPKKTKKDPPLDIAQEEERPRRTIIDGDNNV